MQQKTLGLTIFVIGLSLLFTGFAFSMVVVVVDTTPPAVRLIHPSTATGGAITELVAYVKDPESGMQTVKCVVAGTTYTLSFVSIDSLFNDEKWYTGLLVPISTPGPCAYSWAITNKAGLVTTLAGTYTIYTGLAGKWYVNGIEITSATQTVYATSTTVDFKFTKTAGIADSFITCTVWEGINKLATLTGIAGSMWVGSYVFPVGRHTLELRATDGTQTVTMAVIGMQIGSGGFELPQLNLSQIYTLVSMGIGLPLMGIGLALMFMGKKH